MPMTKNVGKVDFRTYAVSLGGTTMGYVNDVDPSALKLVTADVKVGEIGDIALDQVVVGLTGTIKAALAQTNLDAMRAAMPWAPASGSIPLVPSTQYASLYGYAKALVIHPNGVADTSEDITLLKAVPLPSWMKMSTGNKQRELNVEFLIFPDQTQLSAATPLLVYGYIGPAPV